MSLVKILWVDENEQFATRLSLYAKKHFKGRIDMETVAFEPSEEEIADARLVVVSNVLLNENIKNAAKELVVLHEGTLPEEYLEYEKLFRYKSADYIITFLLTKSASDEDQTVIIGNERTSLIGVKGFLSKNENLMSAISISEVFSETGSTLFVDLTQFSGLREYFEHEGDAENISELLYTLYADLPKTELEKRVFSVIRQGQSYDYILPASNPEHLVECSGEQIAELLVYLKNMGRYRFVVVLTGICMRGFSNLIEIMDSFLLLTEMENASYLENSFIDYIAADISDFSNKVRRIDVLNEYPIFKNRIRTEMGLLYPEG